MWEKHRNVRECGPNQWYVLKSRWQCDMSRNIRMMDVLGMRSPVASGHRFFVLQRLMGRPRKLQTFTRMNKSKSFFLYTKISSYIHIKPHTDISDPSLKMTKKFVLCFFCHQPYRQTGKHK